MPTDPAALVQCARDATTALRDAAREGRVMDFRERDPYVLAIHNALDAPSQSPCGHSSQFAHTEDGGKHIDCYVCETERLRALLARARAQVEFSERWHRPRGEDGPNADHDEARHLAADIDAALDEGGGQ